MKKNWKYILLNILTFGYVGRKVKAKLKTNQNKNTTLSSNDFCLVDEQQILDAFKKDNIVSVQASISSLIIKVKDKSLVNLNKIIKSTKKGVSINNNVYTIIVGQGAMNVAKTINAKLFPSKSIE